MKANWNFRTPGMLTWVLIGLSFLLVPLFVYLIVSGGVKTFILICEITLFVSLAIVILRQPYLGVVVTVASLPILDVFPSIPYFSSVIALLGAVTLGSYLFQQIKAHSKVRQSNRGLFFGLLFIVWLTTSNPAAAFLPSDEGRSWLFTFVQLLLLAWLASQTLDTPHKQRVLMWCFSMTAILSALFALQQGEIGTTVSTSVRSVGLVGGANSTARYFVVSLVFMYFLRTWAKDRFVRLFLAFGMTITLLGTFFTVSRTGLLLLISAVGLVYFLGSKNRRQIRVLLVILATIILIWVFADNVLSILRSIIPSIEQGTDTVGIRYGLWLAGWRMWLEHPVLGVGIGQYSNQLIYYGRDLLSADHLQLIAHNMYIQILAETGLVGFVLFIAMFLPSLRSLWSTIHSDDNRISSLAKIWLIVLILMLVGGITKSDHYDKLIWASLGIGTSQLWNFGQIRVKNHQ